MARYTGPSTRIARKFGEAIFGEDKAFEKKKLPSWSTWNVQKEREKI